MNRRFLTGILLFAGVAGALQSQVRKTYPIDPVPFTSVKVTDQFYTKEGILRHAIHFYEKKKAVENFEDIAISTGSDYKKREV